MNENSRLIPARIITQSNAAINKLQADNELLRAARTAMGGFIGDGTNYSRGINNLKRKMEDYQRVGDGFIQANDADIVDHQKLINLVGDQELFGSDILRQIRDCLNNRGFYNRRIDHYQSVRNNTSWAQRNLAFWDWTYSRARNSQRNYENLRDINNEILARYEQKRDRYNEIEQATRELFTTGCELRAKAKLGVGHIRQATAGLPHSFESDALSAWRTDIQVKKEYADAALQARVDELVASFFDGDNVDVIGVAMDLLAPGLYRGHFTAAEWRAILAIFYDERVSPEEITSILHLLLIGPDPNAPLARTGAEQAFWVDILGSRENVARLQTSMSSGTISSWGGDVRWPKLDVVSGMIRQVSLEFMDRTDELAMTHIWGDARPNDADVFHSIRRSQLFTFFGALEPEQLRSGRFDFGSFGNGGLIDFNASDYLNDEAFDSNVSSYITFNGNRYFVSGWNSFNRGSFASEFGQFTANNTRQMLIDTVPDWRDIALEGTSLALTLFPAKGTGTAGFVASGARRVRSTYSNISSVVSFIDTVQAVRNRDATIAGIDQNWMNWQYATMSSDLGGSVIFMETPNGNVLLFNHHTQASMINYAFLDSRYQATGEHQFSPEVRDDRLQNQDFRAEYFGDSDMVHYRAQFRVDLGSILENDFDSICSDIRNRYSFVNTTTPLNQVPEAVLEELVRIYFEQGG